MLVVDVDIFSGQVYSLYISIFLLCTVQFLMINNRLSLIQASKEWQGWSEALLIMPQNKQ